MKRVCTSAEHALQEVARQNNTTVEEVRKEITLAMLVGLSDSDPAVQAAWNEIPCAGEFPTPEERIGCIVGKLHAAPAEW